MNTTLINTIIPKKINSANEFKALLQEIHTPIKLLGLKLRNRFVLAQDVFEATVKNDKVLTLPENIYIKFKGKGDARTKLNVPKGTTFRAKNATFANTESEGRNIVLDTVDGDLITRGRAKSKVKQVYYNATSYNCSIQKNHKVNIANSYDNSIQKNHKVNIADSYDYSTQKNYKVDDADSHDYSTQKNHQVDYANNHDYSTQKNDLCGQIIVKIKRSLHH